MQNAAASRLPSERSSGSIVRAPLHSTAYPPDEAGIVSWVHFGDLHMDAPDGQNHRDLLALIDKVNTTFWASASFVFLPGDNADAGSAAQYGRVRAALDTLQLPWCAIVGDHDVHERSLNNFLHHLQPAPIYTFQVGTLHFIALNAFSTPNPESFDVSSEQLDWLEGSCTACRPPCVLSSFCTATRPTSARPTAS